MATVPIIGVRKSVYFVRSMIKTKKQKHFFSLKSQRTGRKKHWRQGLSVFKVNAAFLVLWVIACVAYVATMNDMTAKSHQAKKLNKQISELTSGNKDLRLSLSDKQSMETVSEKIKSLGMVEADSVKYVTMPPAAMVRK